MGGRGGGGYGGGGYGGGGYGGRSPPPPFGGGYREEVQSTQACKF